MTNLVELTAVLYSDYSHKHGMYPYHIESLRETVDGGMEFFAEPHVNAWVVIGVFDNEVDAIQFVDMLEQMRPPKVKIP